MSLLEILKQFAARRGLPVPQAVFSTQDDQVLQMAALLNEVLEDLTTRYVGQALQKTATWDLLPQENQGAMEALCPFGYKWVINDTFWDRTQRLPVLGPVDAPTWEALKATPAVGVWLQYRIQEGNLLLIGSAVGDGIAGHKMVLEYASDWSVKEAKTDPTAPDVWKPYFTKDTDTSVFPDSILLAGLTWKWRYEQGLKYAEDFRAYETKVTDYNGHDATKPIINMAGGGNAVRPGIFVPNGNWKVK